MDATSTCLEHRQVHAGLPRLYGNDGELRSVAESVLFFFTARMEARARAYAKVRRWAGAGAFGARSRRRGSASPRRGIAAAQRKS